MFCWSLPTQVVQQLAYTSILVLAPAQLVHVLIVNCVVFTFPSVVCLHFLLYYCPCVHKQAPPLAALLCCQLPCLPAAAIHCEYSGPVCIHKDSNTAETVNTTFDNEHMHAVQNHLCLPVHQLTKLCSFAVSFSGFHSGRCLICCTDQTVMLKSSLLWAAWSSLDSALMATVIKASNSHL